MSMKYFKDETLPTSKREKLEYKINWTVSKSVVGNTTISWIILYDLDKKQIELVS